MSRHKKLTYLTQPEVERFMQAATELQLAPGEDRLVCEEVKRCCRG